MRSVKVQQNKIISSQIMDLSRTQNLIRKEKRKVEKNSVTPSALPVYSATRLQQVETRTCRAHTWPERVVAECAPHRKRWFGTGFHRQFIYRGTASRYPKRMGFAA